MTTPLERDLAERLERLAAAVPVRAGQLDPVHASAVRARQQLRLLWLTPLVALVAVALIGGLVGSGALNLGNGRLSATTRVGDFVLTFTSAKATYAQGEAIDLSASLTYDGPDPAVRIAHAHLTPLGFGIVEPINGVRLSPGWRLSCELEDLTKGIPLERGFRKSGGDSTSNPNFIPFMNDPQLKLPVGTWHAYAVAEFGLGECGGPSVSIRADLTIEVVDRVTVSPLPTATADVGVATPADDTLEVPAPTPSFAAVATLIPLPGFLPTPGLLWHGGPGVTAEHGDETFEVHISTQKGVFSAGEAIEVHVHVLYRGAAKTVDMWSSDPAVSYTVEQLDGPHRVDGAVADVCMKTEMYRSSVQDYLFTKTAAYQADDPDVAWIEAYLASPDVRLTSGTWRLSAHFEGALDECGGEVHRLTASIIIQVLPD